MADIWTDKLSDYIDGELGEADAEGVKAHLVSCPDCRETAAQLRAVAERAAALKDRTPDSDLWAGIASRIKSADNSAEVVDISRAKTARRISLSVPQLLAAGIALMFVSAGSVWMALSESSTGSEVAVADAPELAEPAVLLASFDDPGFDAAVAELERILETERNRLDPATVTVLEQSLATVNEAIAEARAALQTDPSNSYLSEHLSATMNQKVRLLRQAVRLATSAS